MTIDEALQAIRQAIELDGILWNEDRALENIWTTLQALWDTAEEEGRAGGLEEGYTKAQEQVADWNRPAGR